ncbi:MAG: hypothetical protein JO117_09805 [Verrucomicrobia bacterium]|nr:hypothetical protein [Verrucomicrobiota bacterium]
MSLPPIATRSFVLIRTLPLVLLAALPPARGADPAVPSLRDQLRAAQSAEDTSALAEICRQLLTDPATGKPAHPADAAALTKTLIEAQISEHNIDQARATLARIESEHLHPPGTIAVWRGEIALAADKPDEAIAAWRAALAAHLPESARFQEKLAALLRERGNWAAAADYYRQYLKPNTDAAGHANYALCLLNASRLDDADREIRVANRLDATDSRVKSLLPIFDRLRAQAAALRALTAKLATATGEAAAGPLFERALIYYYVGANHAALRDVDAALAADPGARAAQLLKGRLLRVLNRDEEAVALHVAPAEPKMDDLRRLHALDTTVAAGPPDSAKVAAALAGRAAILLGADQPVLALDDAARAAQLNPRNAEAIVVHAAALLRNERSVEALAAARRATELDARNADAWALLGRLEQDTRVDFPAAIDALSRALSIREELKWLQRREHCLRALGRIAEADRDAGRILRLQPAKANPS